MRPLLRLLRLARPGRNRLVLAALAGVAALGCGVGLFAASGYLIARAAQHPSITALTVAVVAVRAFAIGRAVFRYLERLASHDVALRVLADVRVWFYRRVERLAPARLVGAGSGDLVTRLVSDVDAVQDLVVRGLMPVVTGAVVAGAVGVAMLTLSVPVAGVLAAGLVAAGALLPALVLAVGRRSTRRVAAARGRLATEAGEVLAGAADLTAFTATGPALARVDAVDAELTRLARREATALALGAGLSALIVGLTVWLVLLIGVTSVRAGSLGVVALAVVTLTAMAAFEVTQPLPAAAVAFGSARTAAARVFAVADAPAPVTEPAAPLPIPAGPAVVRLRDARARYADSAPWALDGVDLDLTPGRRVALVGPNGAGKSTVIAVLLRFLDVAGGTATLGGVPLASYAAEDVRRVVSGVTQDPHIFATTLRDNLRIGRPDATDDDLTESARQARLLDWVDTLPAGWSTPLGTDGARVSGGERQRIALARALLADPEILVLDEPTAHLDADTAAALTADLLALTRGRTTLLATHDLTGLEAVDEIVVLDRGRVVGRGSHAKLALAPGLYRQMWQSRPVGS